MEMAHGARLRVARASDRRQTVRRSRAPRTVMAVPTARARSWGVAPATRYPGNPARKEPNMERRDRDDVGWVTHPWVASVRHRLRFGVMGGPLADWPRL